MRTALLAIICLPLAVTFAACGGSKKPAQTGTGTPTAEPTATETAAPTAVPTVEPTAAATSTAATNTPPPPKKVAAKDVVLGNTFMFSFADSPDAKKAANADCEKKNKKDQKKLDACEKAAEDAAANEGCRYEKDDKGAFWWVSFGKEKDKEVIYNKVKFTITKEEDGKLTLKPEGKDMGKKPMAKLPPEVVVEVPDENTIAMADPKGRLVYKKK